MTEWPTSGWRTGAPEEKGFDSLKLAEGLLAIRRNGLELHSITIVHDGMMILDAYFYPYDGKTVHEQASVTKSIMTALIGIAADRGLLKLDAPMLSFFPGRAVANRDAAKERITVRHLASMSSGLDCTSANDEQTLKEMERSPDFVQFILDRKMTGEPGTRFVYCSPGMHLLSAILQKAAGMTSLEFARLHLFGPLGIQAVIWPADAQGHNLGWAGVRLHPHDTARIGLLWLNRGRWQGKQIVSREWVESSVRIQMRTGRDDDYGYGWWITGDKGEFAAIGRGGQRIQVLPELDAILVMTGGGIDIDDIEPMITPAFVGRDKPLPANPAGVARLKEALAAVAAPPEPKPVAPMPALAGRISGRTFVFDPNPLEIEACSLEFTADPAVAVFRITHDGGKREPWPVGLDGVYRMSAGEFGLPQGLRGGWVDERTFALEYDNIGNNDHVHLRLTFGGDRVTVESRETAHELGAHFEGRAVRKVYLALVHGAPPRAGGVIEAPIVREG
ncbi:MAG: serine hydrolase, partial [Candidatus Aminicenantes bacterium]|nr:serine hydrolase [Candidatus Aminicenantes bacterium]